MQAMIVVSFTAKKWHYRNEILLKSDSNVHKNITIASV